MSKATLLHFTAEWCGPCKAVKPALEGIAAKMVDRIEYKQIDVDAEQDLAVQYNVRSIPTVLLLDPTGVVKMQIMGARPQAALEASIQAELDRM